MSPYQLTLHVFPPPPPPQTEFRSHSANVFVIKPTRCTNFRGQRGSKWSQRCISCW